MFRLIATYLIVCLGASDVASADELQTVRTNPYHVNAGTIAKVAPNGTVNINRLSNPRFECGNNGLADSDITEGHYLAFIGVNTDFAFEAFQLPPEGTWISRIEIISVV